ncbi:hypothetical protein ACGFZS_48830 [Streptomyces sp. NPDC048288]|uniref:hypothetical protein n=1 Tax=Streptomyces sp. NPDC048288 TaxID=3365529 RepID=UPI00371E27F1
MNSYDRADLIGVSYITDAPDSRLTEKALTHDGHIKVAVPAAHYNQSPPAEHHARYDAPLRQASDAHETGLT